MFRPGSWHLKYQLPKSLAVSKIGEGGRPQVQQWYSDNSQAQVHLQALIALPTWRKRLVFANVHQTSVLTPAQVRDASRTVPRMMMLTTILNGALGLAATITVCFVTTDIERQILNGDPNYPYVEIFAEALDSVGGAVTLAAGGTLICISKIAISHVTEHTMLIR